MVVLCLENKTVLQFVINSSSKNLSFAVTNYVDDGINSPPLTKIMTYRSYIVDDLSKYLPDRVIVGISAATGKYAAVHRIDQLMEFYLNFTR